MSNTLDLLLSIAEDQASKAVILSPKSVAALYFALSFIQSEGAWKDGDDPLDTVTPSDWEEIISIIGKSADELMTERYVALIGQISFFGLSSPPPGWLECNGDVVPQADFPLLYAAIGSNFGAAVGGNFTLPDLRFKTPLGLGELSGNPLFEISIGQQAGQEILALTVNELPAHSHQLLNNNSAARFRHSGTAGANASDAVVAGTTNNATAIMTTSTGVGAPFPLIQPGVGLLACIYSGVE